MATSQSVIADIVEVLKPATAAGVNVFSPRDWPTSPVQTPIVLVQSPTETSESMGPNASAFNVTTSARVIGRLTSLADVGDTGAEAVQAALDIFARQIKVAVVNAYNARALAIEEITRITITTKVSAEGERHVGECAVDFEMRFPEFADDYGPDVTNPLDELAIYTDLINLADPTGTYVNPPFPASVTPAPRAEGPDGRTEGGVFVNFTPAP